MSPFQGQRRNCHVIWLKTAQKLFLILNTLPVTFGSSCNDKRKSLIEGFLYKMGYLYAAKLLSNGELELTIT